MGDDSGDTRDELHGIVSRAHRRLDALFVELEASFAKLAEAPEAVRAAFAALSEQLDVHFEQEDRLYHPSVGTLCPELEPQIRAISDAHRSFRLELAAIGDQLARGELSPARSRVAALAEAFQRHEAREESLLQRVEAGIPQAPRVGSS